MYYTVYHTTYPLICQVKLLSESGFTRLENLQDWMAQDSRYLRTANC